MLEKLFHLVCIFLPQAPFSSLSLFLLICSGYAVTAGHFSHPSSTDVVGGAPQDEGIGKVRKKPYGVTEGRQKWGASSPVIEVC